MGIDTALAELRATAPARPGKLVAIGLNYRDHVREAGMELPARPLVVPASEIPDPQALCLRTRVDGETVQDSTTAEMVFGVAELLSFCSHSFTLEPGDVVLTDTPWGCGEFMAPVRSLQHGDVVEVEIDGIGTLRNPVVELA